jgi:hypothetical protein
MMKAMVRGGKVVWSINSKRNRKQAIKLARRERIFLIQNDCRLLLKQQYLILPTRDGGAANTKV